MKKLLINLLVIMAFLNSQQLFAQSTTRIEIKGIVVDARNNSPIEYATVVISEKQTEKTISGTTTDSEGSFVLNAKPNEIYIEVSFIGYETKRITEYSMQSGLVDLGRIQLLENSQELDEVLIRAEKSTTEFKLDKRVFNVGKDLSTSGASALEVLDNVPSVNVNIEGQISLRGSTGVQILINGKPSILASEEGNALGTITADMIEKIEVITNPSAKYEAEGTSGIINIVIKKEEKKGINGSISLNSGWPHNHSVGLSMNRRTEHFNLFTQMGVGYRTYPGTFETINRDLLANNEITSNGTSEKNEAYYNFVLGTDYHINKYNVLTLSGNYALEKEAEFSNTAYDFYEGENNVSSWNRDETTNAINPKWRYELQYKKDFKDNKDHTLLFSALGHFFGKEKSSDFINSGSDVSEEQEINSDFHTAEYTYKLDYTYPFLKKFTLEAGAMYLITDVSNDYSVMDFYESEWVSNPNLSNVFDYNQKVLGIYATGAYEGEKWGLKMGVRMENTDLDTYLQNTSKTNKNNYSNFFPSAHTSYKISDNLSLQLGYSKRIYRPRMWDLNPFFSLRNNYSIRTGNPELLPEYSDAFELNAVYILGKSSFNLGFYQRYTTDVIERVIRFEDNVSTTMPMNIGSKVSSGIEFNTKYTPTNWLTLTAEANYNYFTREGEFQEQSFDFNSDQWSSKVTTKFKLPYEHEMEITGRYRSAYKSIQTSVSDDYYMDLGVRKKLFKGRVVINLSVRDIFASRKREYESIQNDFYIYNHYQRSRHFTFGVSYGFGKGEAMEFSGQKGRRH